MTLAFLLPWNLQSHEIWIMAIGALVCSSCGILGCFLILKKLSLMGDAISHSVLPGIVIAVMLTGKIHSIWVVLAAGIMGILTPVFTDMIKKSGLVHEDTAIGAVFTTLFALGVVMVSQIGNIDLDVDCVLYGEIATTPLDVLILSGISFGPKAFWILAMVFSANFLFVFLFYKQLKISTFDPALAKAMGLHPERVHYLLMAMISITTIACFEAVGSILVVAMLIVPGACAYLLTQRLKIMLILSIVAGALFSISGYAITIAFQGDVSVSGSMTSAAGVFFFLVLFLSPSQGILVTLWKKYENKHSLIRDHILLDLYRQEEKGKSPITQAHFLSEYGYTTQQDIKALKKLLQNKMVLSKEDAICLSPDGKKRAQEMMRAHRLWEMYMSSLGAASDHVHRSASDMEHILSPDLCNQIDKALDHPDCDPHGKKIPAAIQQ
ncbi:MAG: metal ABC transporter permease [Candidatus Brocadiae bacterium]|nr:metal ABC transporter permease [Candidatus Brocadiia bacterium]